MSNIDYSQLVSAETKATRDALIRAGALKMEVQQRIFGVVDQNTQASLLAAAVAGTLSTADQATFAAGQAWIEATKAAGRAAAVSGDDPVWPDVPAGVEDLASRY